MEWMHRAACTDTDPELFFPVSTEGPGAVQREEAKRVCAGCPVRAECLEYALESKQNSGVWGGLDERERAALHRGRRTRLRSSGAGHH
ncbi:WhiB family transcriptional regulator [Streptomyces sp. NPDC060243]|uniref:WhiB family transcriptional regulator n=1 Tax=Streptomyces sp. NPDC060243 TaxID=3347081 RepID=UPI00365F09F6